jgi:hypothetical protein
VTHLLAGAEGDGFTIPDSDEFGGSARPTQAAGEFESLIANVRQLGE